jgi:type IV pilus assembly protein PilM
MSMTNTETTLSSVASHAFGSLLGRREKNAVVAVDFTPNAISALHVRKDGGELVLDGYRLVRGVGEGAALTDRLCEALEVRLGSEPVVFSVNSPDVMIRRLEVPPMSAKELRTTLPWEARRHIADLADDAVLDAQIIGDRGDRGENRTSSRGPMNVVLVVIPRALYDGLLTAAADLGVEPAFVDVSPLAAMNGLLRDRASALPGPMALLDLGSSLAWLSIFSANDLLLFRDLSARGAEIDTSLARAFGMNDRELDVFRTSGKLPKGDTATPAAVQHALAPLVSELVEDIRSAVLYLDSRAGASLGRVHLSGAHAPILERYGVAEAISAESGVAFERWNPLQGFRFGLVDEIGLRASSGELSAAAGLVARFVQGD